MRKNRWVLFVLFTSLISLCAVACQPKTDWVQRYEGHEQGFDFARDLAVDDVGNVYVTGAGLQESGADLYAYDYVTIKYDPDGNELWVARYDGPANGNDEANALAIDASGQVYVTGASEGAFATIKYDMNGNELWVARHDGEGRSIAIDASGHVYVTGKSLGDFTTIRYDTAGNETWVANYDGPAGGSDSAVALVLDDSGHLFVTGTSSADYATVAYDTAGNELWSARYDGPAHGDDEAMALAVDGAGNVYVTGGSEGDHGSYGYLSSDYATVKYDSDGDELWVARYNGPLDYYDQARALAVDANGNIHVTGRANLLTEYLQFFQFSDYATVKYDADGNELWVAQYGLPNLWADWATSLALDGAGNVYVTGTSKGVALTDDFATVKYDSEGNKVWDIRYKGPLEAAFGYTNLQTKVIVDDAGNVYVAGGSEGPDSDWDMVTIKYGQGLL